MKTSLVILTTGIFALTPIPVVSHHSPYVFFDPSREITVEGTISHLQWQNPHVVLTLATTDATGRELSYTLETHSVSILGRMDLSADTFAVGDQIKAVGWPAKRGGNELFITNLLMDNNREVILNPGSGARFSDQITGDSSSWTFTEADLGDATGGAEGIFHVWSTSLLNGDANLLFENYDFALTPEAAAARAQFDMYSNPILGTCVYKGMPTIMEQPYPMQLVQGHGVIFMHMEEGNTVRIFHMDKELAEVNSSPTPLGNSVGKWEGNALVVTTSGADWPLTDITGVPNSPDAVYIERFTPSQNGKRLDYSMTIQDPNTFAEPPVFTKEWLWVADESVAPYNCIPD